MRLIRSARAMARLSRRLERRGRRIGLVPTMGALHEGHASLIRAAAAWNHEVIVSLFVNPRQFGPREDYRRYPRRLRQDLRQARAAGATIVFAPTLADIYPPGSGTTVDPGPIAARWEGASRPGHFAGVATVVTILFELTRPTTAYFGQKDYQQTLVVRRLARDLALPVQVRVLPTVRERDGLAMSSRNASLSPRERIEAGVLQRALTLGAERIAAGERLAAPLIEAMRRLISEAPGARIDYVAIADPDTLEPRWRLRGRAVILLAVWIGATRLIDNLLVDVP